MNRTKRSSPISACRRTPSHIKDMRRPRGAVSRFVCMRSFRTHIAEPAVRKGPDDRRYNSSPYMQGSVDRRQVTRERVGHSRTGWRRRLATARTGRQHLVVPVPRIHRGNGDCPADTRHRTVRGRQGGRRSRRNDADMLCPNAIAVAVAYHVARDRDTCIVVVHGAVVLASARTVPHQHHRKPVHEQIRNRLKSGA